MGRIGTSIAGFSRRGGLGILAGIVVLALIIVGVVVAVSGNSKTNHVTAYFTSTVGLYQGNDVRILGVKVGKIDSITPDGKQVRVVMSYDGNDKLPATVDAVVVEPSIVSDRFIQLTPGYTGGAMLPDNAVLQTSRTRVPLELDKIFGNLNSLDVALGPKGANRDGALSRLVEVGAKNLRGNGARFNSAIKEFAAAISTLAGSRGDLFATVSNLSKFTKTLADSDGGVRTLNANLAKVGGQLAGERQDLGAALSNLSTALSAVNSFVAANRNNLTGDIHGLAKVTNVLTKEKTAITEFTDIAPLALSDLGLTYDPVAQTLDTVSDATEPITANGPSGSLCELLNTLGVTGIIPDIQGCTGPPPIKSGKSSAATNGQSVGKHPTSLSDLLGAGQ
ncbi:MAG TPA: MCE family protein [Mycobacteriales bacterium]|nr:MCE family protein [Mycobacteriales bacterium]